MIPYGKQSINQADIDALVAALKSDFLTQGPTAGRFEQAVAEYVDAEYAVAANSGTSALHLACLALGLGEGDHLWTSPISFVASANCGLFCGASIDFVDIDVKTANLDPVALEAKLESARREGNLPRLLVVVHFAGQSCDMAAIAALSKKYGFSIVEDACHALGGRYQGSPVGACQYSDITTFSFHPVKSITSAEGGMAVTNNAVLAERMKRLSVHGITRDHLSNHPGLEVPWGYAQTALGFNYRLSDLHAALGLSQLQRLDGFVAARADLARAYDEALLKFPLEPLTVGLDVRSAHHLYVVVLAEGIDRQKVFLAMREQGIAVNVHYIPIYKQPYFRHLGFAETYCSQAEQYYSRALTLPLYPDLVAKDQQRVIDTLNSVLNNHA